ncbi:Oxidase ustYa [Lachnellula arida]|uniref:Oxidase ustYa n=1 Tax=Lachnellula arida TaxID=1316785 RepID=A0A8T9B691_9HELO|nr:Oxidase ustYa [Lachnellula arida]
MFHLFKRPAHHYHSLIGAPNKSPEAVQSSSSFSRWIYTTALMLILCGTCFYAGGHSKEMHSGDFIHLSTEPETFIYNRIYGAKPSNATSEAWDTLFPSQGGFFKHPTLAPQRSALSVFHQLHCLNGIHNGYWFLFEAATSGTKVSESEIPMKATPPHIRHCIDLLRQSLMCQPDISIEPKVRGMGGVSGFGVEHKCKDWKQLMNWVSKWQYYKIEDERALYPDAEMPVH